MKITAGKLDIFLLLPALASLTMIADAPQKSSDLLTLSPLMQGAILTLAALIVGSFAVVSTQIDRRCAEDYLFQLIANAGLIAVITCVLVNMLWLMGVTFWKLPELTGQNMTGVMMLSWVLGYYWFRWRGVKA